MGSWLLLIFQTTSQPERKHNFDTSPAESLCQNNGVEIEIFDPVYTIIFYLDQRVRHNRQRIKKQSILL